MSFDEFSQHRKSFLYTQHYTVNSLSFPSGPFSNVGVSSLIPRPAGKHLAQVKERELCLLHTAFEQGSEASAAFTTHTLTCEMYSRTFLSVWKGLVTGRLSAIYLQRPAFQDLVEETASPEVLYTTGVLIFF